MQLHKLENETESKQLWRIGQAKENGLLEITWDEVASILNEDWHSGDERTAKTYYNRYQQAHIFFEDGMFATITNDSDLVNELIEQKHEIRKEKQKLFDERRDLNAKLRESARYEEDFDRMMRVFATIGKERYINAQPVNVSGDKTMVVCLSDLHIGAEWEHRTGFFSSSTAKERLQEYCSRIIDVAEKNGVSKCVIVFLGDGVSGNIHKTLSVTNKENVIEQIKLMCEYTADFVYELSKHMEEVEFHAVAGNHTRLDKKEDALTDERLDSLVPWFMKNMFMHIDNINIVDKEYDATMCSFYIGNKYFVGVHGDYDGMNDSHVAKLCMWLNTKPYCILMGHKHYHAMTEVAGVKVIQSGSLCGTGDNFTKEKRLSGNPSQTMFICDATGRLESVYPVELL